MSVEDRRLREVLTLDLDPVRVDATARYPLAGVHNSGRGLFKRNDLAGFGTSYKKLHRLRTGHLVVSRQQAFKGAIAVVPPEFHGFHLSPEFLTFSCLEGEFDPQFLSYLCAWPDFWQRVASAHGEPGTIRERVLPGRFSRDPASDTGHRQPTEGKPTTDPLQTAGRGVRCRHEAG